jgi:hypothetical protein
MIITDEKWNDIIAETQARIDKWNESAQEHQKSDVFRIKVQDEGDYTVLLTEHLNNGDANDRKVVVREIATGEMRRAAIVKYRGRVKGFKVWRPDPKAWRLLVDKPAAEIVRQLKLTRFLMLLSSRADGITRSLRI